MLLSGKKLIHIVREKAVRTLRQFQMEKGNKNRMRCRCQYEPLLIKFDPMSSAGKYTNYIVNFLQTQH